MGVEVLGHLETCDVDNLVIPNDWWSWSIARANSDSERTLARAQLGHECWPL
jgi:hypothetical protein